MTAAAGPREQVLQRTAAGQRGLVSHEQLRAAGFTSGTIARWVAVGRLHRLHRGVFVLGHRDLSPWARELAAVLAVGRGGFVSHQSAAAVWGMRAEAPSAVDVTVAYRKVRSRRGIRVHRTTRIAKHEIVTRRGMPTSSPARTLVDLAGVVGRGELEKALEIARIRGTISEAALRGAIALAGPSRGAAAMAAALKAEGEPAITRSTAERRVRALVRAAGLPPPLVNAKVAAYEVDLLWPRHRLIAEIDSYGCHSSRAAFERARVKQGRLAAAGFTVLRITWRRLVHEPQGVIGELAAAIALREVG